MRVTSEDMSKGARSGRVARELIGVKTWVVLIAHAKAAKGAKGSMGVGA